MKALAKKLYRTLKLPLSYVRQKVNDRATLRVVTDRLKSQTTTSSDFDFSQFRWRLMGFIQTMQTDQSKVRYRYSTSTQHPTLYSSAYVCLTLSLLGELKKLDEATKEAWVAYFDSFQSAEDGLFYDETVRNQYYDDSDWWGARHQALHMVNAYTSLQAKPKHELLFLRKYYDLDYVKRWLDENGDKFEGDMNNDFDNKLMNVVCLLQYQRDTWNDDGARRAVDFVQQYLLKKLNPNTGIWGNDNIQDPALRSRKVQFAYHLFPFFFYDSIFTFDLQKVIDVTLLTQNTFGGYAPIPNSSACDDIDSVDILIRLNEQHPDARIHASLQRAFRWILCNQMKDGGFVFRLNEAFTYGHEDLHAHANTGAVFPTWFRTLSLAYLSRYFKLKNDFTIIKCPGYEF